MRATPERCPAQLATTREVLVAWALRGLIVAGAVVHVLEGEVLYSLMCGAALALVVLPPLLARSSRLNVPVELEVILLWWLVADMVLGRAFHLYETSLWYDKALHLGNSALVGYIAFLFVYALHLTGRLRTSWKLDGVIIVVTALGVGALWEIVEYFADLAFARGAQGSPLQRPLDDTMWDLVLDGAGGAIGAVLGAAYIRFSRRSRCRAAAYSELLGSPSSDAPASLEPGGARAGPRS